MFPIPWFQQNSCSRVLQQFSVDSLLLARDVVSLFPNHIFGPLVSLLHMSVSTHYSLLTLGILVQ